jgi:nitrite reductase/ring-hydroxylating ferredoxin subunit
MAGQGPAERDVAGPPVHPAVTDVPVGALTVGTMLDLAGYRRAADIAIATGVAGMVASAVTGAADAVDAYGRPQVQATGRLEDGCVRCPWHGSRFRPEDGRVVRGPSVYDQPFYEVRRSEAGLEARRRPRPSA